MKTLRMLLLASGLLASLPIALPAAAQEGAEALRSWRASAVVTVADVERFGIDACFSIGEIDDATFARMQGRSYKAECTLPRSDLRYVKVLHVDAEGRIRLGELVCHGFTWGGDWKSLKDYQHFEKALPDR